MWDDVGVFVKVLQGHVDILGDREGNENMGITPLAS